MNATIPNPPGSDATRSQEQAGEGVNQAGTQAGNPYTARYEHTAAPDLDAGAPQLRSHELRRMNQRALALLGAVVLLLLFAAY